MIRKQAIRLVAKEVGDLPIVSANGFISRDLFETFEKSSNFYMIGSMGLASSIGLGLAMKLKKKVFIFDGDGNILMNLGSMVTIGAKNPKNLVHIVFDNNAHESTGGQFTNSSIIPLEKFAKAANYKIFVTNSSHELKKIIKKVKNMSGPIFVLVKISKSQKASKRVSIEPVQIKNRFMKSI